MDNDSISRPNLRPVGKFRVLGHEFRILGISGHEYCVPAHEFCVLGHEFRVTGLEFRDYRSAHGPLLSTSGPPIRVVCIIITYIFSKNSWWKIQNNLFQ